MYLRAVEIYDLKYTNLILRFFQLLSKLAAIDMILTVEKGIRGGICHVVYWYAKANSKYMKECDKYK